MARPRSFDENEVLDAAMTEFWRRGYAAASTRDLAECMGMCAPSLYNAFGGKRTLFIHALQHYATNAMRTRLRRIETGSAGLALIRAYFSELLTNIHDDPERRGCFIINTALEVAPHDEEISAAVVSYLGEVRSFFERGIRSAQQLGETPAALNASEVADTLLGVMLGISVLGRTSQDHARFEAMLSPVFTLLQSHTPAATKKGTP